MKIAMMSPYSLSVPGGVQGQVLALARAVRAKGHYVRVLGPCDGPPPEPGITPLGNSMPTGANGSMAPIAPDPAAQLRTIRVLRDERFDVLHLHEPFAPGPTTTTLLIKPAPVVATFHAAGTSLAYKSFRPLLVRGTSRIDRQFVVSQDARDMATEALGGVYEDAFNGVDVDLFRSVAPHATTGPTIFFVARHEDRKGLRTLLDAVSQMTQPLTLWIGGVGPETDELKKLHSDDPRLAWLGEIDDDEKIARMRGADVFCAPSLRGESFGIVLLEAMASDTAVVASDLPGYSKVARAGTDAALVPPGDSAALASELSAVIADSKRREGLVASGRQRVLQFSMSALADLYLDAYHDVVDAGIANKYRTTWQ